MAYAVTNPPVLVSQAIGYQTGARIWFYKSADAGSDVDVDGYFTNADALGMEVGDLVIVQDTDTSATTMHTVKSVTAGGAGDIGDGTAVATATDSD